MKQMKLEIEFGAELWQPSAAWRIWNGQERREDKLDPLLKCFPIKPTKIHLIFIAVLYDRYHPLIPDDNEV